MARRSLLSLVLVGLATVLAVPLDDAEPAHDVDTKSTVLAKSLALPAPLCFPSLGFAMPDKLPADNTEWWCDPATEYAFLGFSYEITDCERRFSAAPCHTSYRLMRLCYRPESRAAEYRLPQYPPEVQLALYSTVRFLRQRGLLVSVLFLQCV